MATKLNVPIPEEQIRALKVGDQVLLSGVIFTGRDAAHKYMIDNFVKGPCPDSERELYEVLKKELAGSVIYHCGPVVRKRDDGKQRQSRYLGYALLKCLRISAESSGYS